jgi:hypothetical protein
MRISFPIRNLSAFRTVGPIVDAALTNPRWEVELLLERSARHSNKAYEKPSVETVPSRLRQRCRVRLLESVERLVSHLKGADVVVSHVGRAALLPSVDTSQLAARPLWAAVFDAEHSTTPLHRFDDADAVFWPTPYFMELAIQRGVAPRSHLESRSHFCGYLRSDALALTSRDQTRVAWDLPLDRPVVLYMPDAFWFADATRVSPWYRLIWRRRREGIRRILWHLMAAVSPAQEAGGFGLLSQRRMLQALRAFCDRNHAALILARRRQKDCDGARAYAADELAVADGLVQENVVYPQTLPQAIQMADLVVCPYPSGAVLEAAAARTPYLTVGLPMSAYAQARDLPSRNQREDFERFAREQGRQPGVTWWMPAEAFIREFPLRCLADFAIDPVAYEGFAHRYLGSVDGDCGGRIIRALEEMVRQRHAADAFVSP